MQIHASTPAQYLAKLPAERRAVLAKVRSVIRKRLPKGYKETTGYGMLVYVIPLSTYPVTYNGQPLMYAALAAQKNNYAIYLMAVYGDKRREAQLRDGFKAAGKKLDMGKSCIRFKRLEDLALPVIGDLIAGIPMADYIERYETIKKPKK
jgi:hypothetical protein